MFCNVPAPPADPSNPGCVPERGSALTDGRTDAIPADLASPAWLWTLIRRCQVNQNNMKAEGLFFTLMTFFL